jgi:phthalate 4,5-cis-dihydrodiol dehydrogenase
MTDERTLGIGIIGTGRISGAHAVAARAVAGVELAGCADVDPERRARFTDRHGGAGYASYEELLARPEVEAVVVALPHFLHCDVTIAALQAGKHVLLEKPMAMTVAECDAMIAAAENTGRTLMVAHSQYFFPVNQTARALIAEGAIGPIVFATDTWYKPFYADPRPPWFLDARQGGGMWPMNGSHMIDRMTTFIGSEIIAVKAMVGTYFVDVPATDTGIALLQFRNGVHATVHHCGYRAGQGVERFEGEITGVEGQLRFTTQKLWRCQDGKYEEVPVTAALPPLKPDWPADKVPGATFANQLAAFRAAIRTGQEPVVSARYGREIVRVLEACEQSARLGREVRLDRQA